MTDLVNPVDGVLEAIALAVAQWKEENTEETIKKKVIDLLNKNSEEITLKLLGFNNRHGQWALDHCNGRSGNSAAGDYLTTIQQTAIQEWMQTVTMPKLSNAMKDKLSKDMRHDYEHTLHKVIREAVFRQAEVDAQALISKLTVSNQAENYLKVVKLLHPQTNTD